MESKLIVTDIAVAGGGPAGLAAATFLARSGSRVTLLERSATLGGRSASQDRAGYSFNRGVHALYMGGAAARVLDELGVPSSGGSPNTAYALHEGRLAAIPTSITGLLRTRLLGPWDKFELARFFSSVPRLIASDLAGVSVEEWLSRSIHGRGVRRLLDAVARTLLYSASLDLASTDTFVGRLQMALRQPVRYVDGGWQTLVDGMLAAARSAGVQILTGVHVTELERRGNRVQSLRLAGGGVIQAATSILALDAREAARLLQASVPSFARSIEQAPAAEVACLDVALSRLPSSRYAVVQDLDRGRFLSTQSLFARVAPAGGGLVQAVKQRRAGAEADPERDERDLEELFDLAQPGWRDLVIKRVFLPSMEASSILPTAATGGLAGRPGHRVAGLSNCWVAGDWVGPEGYLLDAALASARRTAELVREDQERLLPGAAVAASPRNLETSVRA